MRVRGVCVCGMPDGVCAGCASVEAAVCAAAVRLRRAASELRRAGGECMAVSLGGSEIRWRHLP